MRGSPLLRIAIALLGIGMAAFPLLRLTGERDPLIAPGPVPSNTHANETPVTLRLRFSPELLRVRVSLEGRELLGLVEPTEWEAVAETALPIPPEGIELEVKAEWPDTSKHSALTLEVEPDGLASLSHTAWTSEPALLEFFTFQWK